VPDRPNLVHDTVYRRTRRRLTAAFHRADAAATRLRHRRTRVLFEAASPVSVSVFRPMLARLCGDPRLEFWFTTCDRAWRPGAIFGGIDTEDRVILPSKARWMKFDAYVNTDFWNMTWLPRRTRRMHLFHGVAGKYGLDAPTRIAPVVSVFDRILFANRDRMERYIQAGLVDPSSGQAALVGYPKVDCLVDGTLNRRAIERAIGVNPDRPTVLYAPTWSPYSSLNRMGRQIVEALARMPVNVVVKLHDRSYDQTARASGGVDWRKELEPLSARHGVRIAAGADASPYLFVSDALVTDHSSIGFEYMLLDRPIVVADCPELIEKARVNPQKVDLLRRGADVAGDPESVAAAVARGLAQPDAHSAERRQISSELFYKAGGATARAVQCFYGLVGLPVPDAEGAAVADMRTAFTPFEAGT
jgi:CDP-glycerol glycerophosphotransferase